MVTLMFNLATATGILVLDGNTLKSWLDDILLVC